MAGTDSYVSRVVYNRQRPDAGKHVELVPATLVFLSLIHIFRANIVPGSVKAPETWYSKWLDPLFGVE